MLHVTIHVMGSFTHNPSDLRVYLILAPAPFLMVLFDHATAWLSYPCADTTSAGGDLEVSIQVFDGSAGEEALHHQQDPVDEECRCNAIDHILNDVNAGGEKEEKHLVSRSPCVCA